MAGLTRLEEKHKRVVELIIRGTPRKQICDEVGIGKSTLYDWVHDPLLLAYMEHMIQELAIRRQIRLEPVLEKAIAVLMLMLQQAEAQLSSPDPAERLKAPSVGTILDAVQKLHGLERIDAGAPTSITKTITSNSNTPELPAGAPTRSIFAQLMDGVVVDQSGVHPMVDVTPEPNPEETE